MSWFVLNFYYFKGYERNVEEIRNGNREEGYKIVKGDEKNWRRSDIGWFNSFLGMIIGIIGNMFIDGIFGGIDMGDNMMNCFFGKREFWFIIWGLFWWNEN